MKKCDECKYCIQIEEGYSNYTVEGNTADCLLNKNPDFPVDTFYREEPALEFADKCESFIEGKCVNIDVEREEGYLENYSDDPEIKELLRNYEENN